MAVFQMCQKSQLHRRAINNFKEPKGPIAHFMFHLFCWHNILVASFLFNKVYFDNYIKTISYI